MSNKNLAAIAAICIITIAFSGLNSFLIYSNSSIQQEQLNELKNRLGTVESALTNLSNKINVTEYEAEILRLNSSLNDLTSQLSNLENANAYLLNQTPANIYQSAHKSVVVIRTPLGQGSGFLYYNSSLILTNWHVVESETAIEVEFYDRSRKNATLVGSDAYADVAVIMVLAAPLDAKPLQLESSSNLWIGQQVIAIGNPLGLTGSLSSGYISQINRRISITGLPIIVPVLQLDVTIAPGSSGGPLLDLLGNVVGITNAGTSYGINFAVPSNIVERVASSIIKKGYYQHPFVGFVGTELTPEAIKSMNILNIDPFQTGLLITDVNPNTPAADAGLRPAVATKASDGSAAYNAMDIILDVDNHPMLSFEDWSAYIEENVSPGQPITLTLWRSGNLEPIVVTTTYRPQYPT
jgi:S1-C subfamily serine protease